MTVLQSLAHAPATLDELAILTRQDESAVWLELFHSLGWWGFAEQSTDPRTPSLWSITDLGRGRLAAGESRLRDARCEGVGRSGRRERRTSDGGRDES